MGKNSICWIRGSWDAWIGILRQTRAYSTLSIKCGNTVPKAVSSYHIELWWEPIDCYITLIYHIYVPRWTQLWAANGWLWDSGVRLNIKTSTHQHRHFHYENKLIFIIEIPIPGKTVFILRRGPGSRLLCDLRLIKHVAPIWHILLPLHGNIHIFMSPPYKWYVLLKFCHGI